MPPITNYCRTCRILDPTRHICQLTGHPKDPDKDYCSQHAKFIHQCENCGQIALETILVFDSIQYRIFCPQCAKQLNTCHFCQHGNECTFETSTSSIPKFVQKQIRQGNLVSIQTVKNPSRMEITCFSCECFNKAENICLKDFNYCERMSHIYGNPSESLEVY